MLILVEFFLILVSGLTWGSIVAAQTPPVPSPTPYVVAEPGQPVVVKFNNGDEAVLHASGDPKPFVSSLVLTENACRTPQNAVCKISFPKTSFRYLWIWSKNSSGRVGQTLKRSSSSSQEKFETWRSSSVKFSFGETGHGLRGRPQTSPYAELRCDTNDWIPWNARKKNGRRSTTIVSWEEDFEADNLEFLYFSNSSQSPSFNQITSRAELIPVLESSDGTILLGTPKIRKDRYGGYFFFPMLGYKLQLTFPSQSLADADDRMCQAKLTIDFTALFNEFQKIFPVEGKEWSAQDFKPVMTESSEYRSYLKSNIGDKSWSGEYQ